MFYGLDWNFYLNLSHISSDLCRLISIYCWLYYLILFYKSSKAETFNYIFEVAIWLTKLRLLKNIPINPSQNALPNIDNTIITNTYSKVTNGNCMLYYFYLFTLILFWLNCSCSAFSYMSFWVNYSNCPFLKLIRYKTVKIHIIVYRTKSKSYLIVTLGS